MQEAFYFGPDDCQAFGIYHPAVSADNRVMTVLCPPLFSELNRSHSLLRKLALSLSALGQHVLRFDYRYTGDSFGDLIDASLNDWIRDIEFVIEEGLELTGCSEVHVLACRASSLLACKSIDNHQSVSRLVLWDPVTDGRQYLNELQNEQNAILEQHPHLGKTERKRLSNQLGMYDLSPTIISEFEGMGSDTYAGFSTDKLRVITTQSENQVTLPGVVNEEIDVNCDWKTNTAGVILSQPILEGLSSNLTKS